MSVILNALKVKKKTAPMVPVRLPREGFFAPRFKSGSSSWRWSLISVAFLLGVFGVFFITSLRPDFSLIMTKSLKDIPAEPLAPVLSPSVLKNNEGLALLDQDLPQEAEQKFREALNLDPLCAPCANNLGLLKTRLSLDTEAEEWLKKSLELDPQLSAAQFNLGVLEEKRGNTIQAALAYQAFLSAPGTTDELLVYKVRRRLTELTQK